MAVLQGGHRLGRDHLPEEEAGIYEFLLGGEADTKLLEVRVFDEKTKLAAYGKQTKDAEAAGTANCPRFSQQG